MNLNNGFDNLSQYLLTDDPENEDKANFSAIKLIYFLLLSLTVAGLIAAIVISTLYSNGYESMGLAGFFLWGFAGTISIVITLVMTRVFIHLVNTSKKMVLFSRIFQGLLFLAPAFAGFIFTMTGERWWVVIPLFINTGITLALTFPTRSRWNKWTWEDKNN